MKKSIENKDMKRIFNCVQSLGAHLTNNSKNKITCFWFGDKEALGLHRTCKQKTNKQLFPVI